MAERGARIRKIPCEKPQDGDNAVAVFPADYIRDFGAFLAEIGAFLAEIGDR